MQVDRKVLEQALKALENAEEDSNCEYGATAALRAALEQPEQKPVAVLLEYENGERELRFKNNGWPAKETPLYAQPPRNQEPLCK